MKMFKFMLLLALCFQQISSQNTGSPSTASTTADPSTTTPAATTTTEGTTTTTTEATTTTTEPATTTATPIDTTTVEPKAYWSLYNRVYGASQGDQVIQDMDDGCADALHIKYDVPFAGKTFRKIYVCVNGIVCLNKPLAGYYVPRNGERLPDAKGLYCMSPFFLDHNTKNNTGKVWYHLYDLGEDCSLTTDNTVILAKTLVRDNFDATFDPALVLTVTWEGLWQYGGALSNTSTFQLIFTTDGEKSYSFYFYGENMMKSAFGFPFIGQIIDSLASGLVDDSVDGSYLRTADQNLLWKNKYGGMVYRHENVIATNYRIKCQKWHACEKSSRTAYRTALASMPLCPCTLDQGSFDPNFDFGARSFLGTGQFFLVNLLNTNFGQYGKTCGYLLGWRSFFVGGSFSGSFTKYHPTAYPRQYLSEDVYHKSVCCEQSDLCSLYYDVRPEVTTCFIQPRRFRFGFMFGDPHFTTIDGLQYTFNGHGEYTLLKIAEKNIEIQARTEPFLTESGNATLATVFTAFVVKGSDFWLQVELTYDRSRMQIYAGQNKSTGYFADYTLDYYARGDNFRRNLPRLTLERYNQTLVTKFSSSGLLFNVTQGRGLLQMGIAVDESLKSKCSGLLGNYNDNPNDDLLPRGSTAPILPSSIDEDIHKSFGSTWAITAQESQFRYIPGKTHASYSFPDFRPGFYEEITASQRSEASAVCGVDKKQCIYDYVYTGNGALALDTSSSLTDLAVLDSITNNLIPSLSITSGARVLNNTYYVDATVGTPVTLRIVATDTDAVTIRAVVNTASAQLTANGDASVTAKFTLSNINPVQLSFVGTDVQGASSAVLEVTVVACNGCSSHGTCDFTTFRERADSNDTFEVASCTCKPYWEGMECADDVNGCTNSPCLYGQNCTDRPAAEHEANPSLKPYSCTGCPPGYEPSADKCSDKDECNGSNPCMGGTCTNTDGSFMCSCSNGYRLATDKVTCKDINECEESSHSCDQICANTVGSFTCKCHTGYTRNAANTACVQSNASSVCTGQCVSAAGCYNDSGSAKCFCTSGYKLEANNTCSNINECALGLCSQGCTDTVGSYTCSCYIGYMLANDKVTCNPCPYPSYGAGCRSQCNCGIGSTRCDHVRGCVCAVGWRGTNCDTDVNECLIANICQDDNKQCNNNDGSYSCTCRDGFQQLANGSCVDIDECANSNLNGCEQTCTNTLGGFTCGCYTGYNIDPNSIKQCNDYDECLAGVSGCQQICVNLDGRFNCECRQGFRLNLDRRTCTAVPAEDPCANVTRKNCSDICTVENGTAVCQCNAGYQLGADQQTCIDIDECNDLTLNRCTNQSLCMNSAGSYVCSCVTGQKLANDNRTCTVCDEYHWGVNCANTCDCGPGATSCNPVTGCVCNSGWTGTKCNVDKNECDTRPCTAQNEGCINTAGSYECHCLTGYSNVNGNCENIDECSSPTLNQCSQVCTDTPGSYTCSCNPGFTKNSTECIDVNECLGPHDCQQVCTNVEGSYRCSCEANFQLNSDKRTCSATNACTSSPCSGKAQCAKVNGTDTCFCDTGYTFDTNSITACIDIKECSSNTTNRCNQKCLEKAGSYQCVCDQVGYKLDVDSVTCKVCEEGKYGANCTSTCTCEVANNNTKTCSPVTGACTCWDGWNGTNCQTNIKECTALSSPCPENSACVDTVGSYECVCSQGYIKAADGSCIECDATHYGISCSKVCSCVTANTADCNNVNGACTCKSGWTGPTCSSDINECLTPDVCNDSLKTCTNTQGSHVCSCIPGYTINSSGVCIDVNECLLGTHTCKGTGQACKNSAGGFTCVCEPGYSGSGATCTACSPTKWGPQCQNNCNCNATNSVTCDPVTGCVCKTGWTGTTCSQDIDECTSGTHTCPAKSVCSNNAGNYTCLCITGYKPSGNFCVPCDGNMYGASCALACNCNTTNAANSAQTCNHVTGACECKTGSWTGDRCQTDIDECAVNTSLCKDKANQGCHNKVGSYECSCLVGFMQDSTGACVNMSATTPPTSPPAGEKGIDLTVKFNLTIGLSVDLNVNSTNVQYKILAKQGLDAYFLRKMTITHFKRVFVRHVEKGSLIVYMTAVISDSNMAQQNFSETVYDLLTGDVVVIDAQNTSVLEMSVGGSPLSKTASLATITCLAYLAAHGPCQSNEECVVTYTTPVCQPVKTSDNFALVVGLGVGIPLFFVAVLVIAIIAIYVIRTKKKTSFREFDRTTFDRGFFPVGIPTKINTYGGNDPLYVPYTWDQDSSASFTTSSSEASKKRRRKIRGDAYPEPDINYIYDNDTGNHFSWDFLYNYIAPNERYEIQRPHINDRRNY